tara:strand:- start:2726 stop:2974 length:249 start_codon:yes stop_codon:yes gene_type:complete
LGRVLDLAKKPSQGRVIRYIPATKTYGCRLVLLSRRCRFSPSRTTYLNSKSTFKKKELITYKIYFKNAILALTYLKLKKLVS